MLFPLFTTTVTRFIFRFWFHTDCWPVLSDLFVRPKRALLRYRLLRARRRMWRFYKKKQYDKVEELAPLCLDLSSQVGSPDLRQLTIHTSHTLWGSSLCIRGDVKGAAAHLMESGKVEGAPALRSMPPLLFLAQAMIEQGEHQATVAFLVELKRWWVCGAPLDEAFCKERTRLVNIWIGQAERGRVPTGLPWFPAVYRRKHQ